jgi:hypothetical protein
MADLRIAHHERISSRPHRWRVHLHGRSTPVEVELPEEERAKLDLSDEDVHTLLPTALQRRHAEAPEDLLPPEDQDVAMEAPVRVYQTHFMA